MASERIQRQIDRLLDEAEEAMAQLNWEVVYQRSRAVLALESDNPDALTYLGAAERELSGATPSPIQSAVAQQEPTNPQSPAKPEPTSFANGRYEVRRFLG
ncbi:MAG: hypothetical protein ACE5Q6_19505 [Dehalococcoidia bacterium]